MTFIHRCSYCKSHIPIRDFMLGAKKLREKDHGNPSHDLLIYSCVKCTEKQEKTNDKAKS